MKKSASSFDFYQHLRMAAAVLVVLLAAVAAGPASAGDPYAYYDWNVQYKIVAPLGVEQQVQKKKKISLLLFLLRFYL